ncbi:LysR family transcriptional regulator [Actinomadura harenae]|uniref:LysR family transcriptional regulator n=2 Tax=Actinomadura harenae TaxID=2483351 RepID=A0A3M2LGC6_9ACTN|nr:LysR family transcriptional regulator [Actinomadura harenae]
MWAERVREVPLQLIQTPTTEAVPLLRDGGVDAAFVRLPVDREGLHVIPLYLETTVVVVPKDHDMAAVEEVELADLADEDVIEPLDDVLTWDERPGQPAFTRPATTAGAVELVASGAGVLLVPQSLARLHHRKDLTYRTVNDSPQSQIGLAWLEGETSDLMEELIGIVRGRTPNSTRGRAPQQAKPQPQSQPGRKKPPQKNTAAGKQQQRRRPRRRA